MSKSKHTPDWVKFDKPFHAVADRMWISNITENANTENENMVCRVEGSTEDECAKRADLLIASPALLSACEKVVKRLEKLIKEAGSYEVFLVAKDSLHPCVSDLTTAINAAKPKEVKK